MLAAEMVNVVRSIWTSVRPNVPTMMAMMPTHALKTTETIRNKRAMRLGFIDDSL
jgi:hypothetical protein